MFARIFYYRSPARIFLQTSRMACEGNSEISYEDLKARLGNLLLVDVRSEEEVNNGRIPGSIHIPVATVDAALQMTNEEFLAKYGVTKPPLDTKTLVFHCHMGKRGAAATSKAIAQGYVNACNYAGGYREWAAKEGK
ncbi:thiosulfate:glutathione sulfurtransferase [Neosynchiropus ocellatus]